YVSQARNSVNARVRGIFRAAVSRRVRGGAPPFLVNLSTRHRVRDPSGGCERERADGPPLAHARSHALNNPRAQKQIEMYLNHRTGLRLLQTDDTTCPP